jgi:hypothetical protein
MKRRRTTNRTSFKAKNRVHTIYTEYRISAHAAETIDFLLLLEPQSRIVSPPTLISTEAATNF